jgi:hypothetical protein
MHVTAFPLSILEASDNFSKLWLLQNFIWVSFEKRYGNVLTYRRPFFWFWNCFQLKISLHYPCKNVIWNIVKYIQKGYHVFICVNENYIPDRFAYQRYDNNHEILIYGYDNERRCFQTIAYNIREKYERQSVSYEDIDMAFKNNPEHYYKFYALRIKRGYDFGRYRKGLLRKNIRRYLSSSGYAYETLYKLTKEALLHNQIIDTRSYLVLRNRASVFGNLPIFFDIEDKTKRYLPENESRAEILFMKILKWNYILKENMQSSFSNHSLTDSILEMLSEYAKTEMQIMRTLLQEIC